MDSPVVHRKSETVMLLLAERAGYLIGNISIVIFAASRRTASAPRFRLHIASDDIPRHGTDFVFKLTDIHVRPFRGRSLK